MKITTINLEEGLPLVKEALAILDQEILRYTKTNLKVLKLIHGYGSSGSGGKIRTAIRKELLQKKEKNEIINFIPGEKWSIFDEASREIITKSVECSKDCDLNKHNNGITIVILK